MAALFYSSSLIFAGSVSHSIAILCTIFRLVYRGWTRYFWWEDVWAAFALITDVFCLVCIWLDKRVTSWILAIAFTSVLWAARMSIIFSVIHIVNHSGCKIHKQITYLIAVSFACMWVALVVQKINQCQFHSCQMAESVALSHLITDIIADASLVAAPLHLWRNVGLSRSRKILVLSTFGTSLLITAVTIPHSIILLKVHNTTTLIFAHVKAALSLIICNLLVIVTYLYRVCSKDTVDLNQSFASNGIFTSVVMTQMPSSTNSRMSGITSRQITVQIGGMKSKDDDTSVRCAEEGTNTESS
ncbi:hypothetical protein EDB19DRAFT_967543 [Suillus lakei]|nr:hypothetical protein EDB19DRAFT_967543 [Suillus lakei]